MSLGPPRRILAAALGLALLGTAAGAPLTSVGVTVGDLSNPFFVQIAKGAEKKARELGGPGVGFTAVSSGYDLNLQMNQMDDFIAAHVSLIVLGAADSQGIAPAVRRARAAHIAVVAVDVGAGGGVDATVMSDNVQAGRLGAEFIVAKLKGRGDVVLINGPPVSATIDRIAGAEAVFRRAPDIHILSRDQNAGGSRMGGLNAMSDLLTAFSSIDAVFAVNDPTGLGAALAVRQARRKGVIVVGVDGAPEAAKALRDGSLPFYATAAQDPFTMAERAVEVGYEAMQGRLRGSPVILIPVALVTRDTVGNYQGWTKE